MTLALSDSLALWAGVHVALLTVVVVRVVLSRLVGA